MTVTASPNFVVYDGDGVTTAFGYSFAIATSDGSDIDVYVVDDLGNVTLLTGNYSINLNTAQVLYPTVGGVAPLETNINAVPAGWSIILMRVEPLSQEVVLTDQGVISLAALESGLDVIVMQIQQLQEQINRCVKYPVGTLPTTVDVNAFIAAVSAVIAPAPTTGTYAYCKTIALANPSLPLFGIVTDLGTPGTNQLFWYSGNPAVGDSGWFGPLAGA